MRKISGILLSAGESKRMGEPKALLVLKGKKIINKLLEEYLGSLLAEVVLVLGFRADDIKKAIDIKSEKLKIVVNEHYEKEMFSSIQRGMEEIQSSDAILIGLIDHPFISRKLINWLINQYETNKIIIPSYNGRKGHPIIIPFSLKDEIVALNPENYSLRDVIHRHENDVKIVKTNTDSIIFDMDTREEYERAKRYEENKN